MFNNNPYTYMPQAPAYQRPAYQPMQMFQQPVQQPAMMQDDSVQIRCVGSREEVVASSVMPGIPCWFEDRAHGMMFKKYLDPQTGIPSIEDYARVQQEKPPQYATVETLSALRGDLEQMIDQRIANAQAARTTARKGVTNDE